MMTTRSNLWIRRTAVSSTRWISSSPRWASTALCKRRQASRMLYSSPRGSSRTGAAWMRVASERLSQSRRSMASMAAAAVNDPDDDSSLVASSAAAPKLSLYMWGTDTKGCLLKPPDRQDEKMLDLPHPIPLSLPQEKDGDAKTENLSQVICGPTSTAFLTRQGSCWVVGENKEGELGLGHKQPVTTPTRVQLPRYSDDSQEQQRTIQQVSLGPLFSAFVDQVGDLYTTGFGGSTFSGMGALGHGSDESFVTPQLVHSLVEDNCYAKQVAVGEAHMTVLTTEGEVLTCGAGSYGRLGNYDTIDQLYLEPVEVLGQNVTQIAGGKSFTLALTDEGVLYGWGRNHKGQLGTGFGLAVDMYAMQSIPEPMDEVGDLAGQRVTQVSAGHSHAACITDRGELFFWGMSLHLEPVRVNELIHTEVVQVACGEDYTLALDRDGNLYSFGAGRAGTLGQGEVRQLNQAQRMEAFAAAAASMDDPKTKKIVQISAGWKHAACLVQEEP